MKGKSMIIYDPKYQKSNTKYIAVHHEGGIVSNPYLSTQKHTAERVNQAHRERWNFLDPLTGKYIGYNFYLEADGKITQGRAIGSETCAQKGYNFNGEVISICLAGNFTKHPKYGMIDTPTELQKASLKELCLQFPQIKPFNIVPHRHFGMTACFGDGLLDNWSRNVVYNEANQLSFLMELLSQLMTALRKFQAPLGSIEEDHFLLMED